MSAPITIEEPEAEINIDMTELWHDPYPTWMRLQKDHPVAFVPVMDRYLVTRSADIRHIEAHPEIFSSEEEGSLMIRAMGQNMMRKDGHAHNRERMACTASVGAATGNKKPLDSGISTHCWRPD